MLDLLAILLGIVFTQALVLSIFRHARGYMWRGASWIAIFLLLAIAFEFIIAYIFFAAGVGWAPFPKTFWAFLVGVLAVSVPNVLEYFVLLRNPSEKRVQTQLVKALRKLNLDIIHQFGWAIRARMEQDAFDCSASGWGLGPTGPELGRKIRMLYAHHMYDIAAERQDSSLVIYDVEVYPAEKFYLLAEHLGRKKLRKLLSGEIPALDPLRDWDGRERRKRVGRRDDRLSQRTEDPTWPYSRSSDNQQLMERLSMGRRHKGLSADVTRAEGKPSNGE